MLNEGQRDNIRLAYRAAERSGNDTVLQNRVRQLSRDFGISENEVRGIAKGAISEPAKAAGPTAKGSAAHGRSEWTPEQVRRLVELHNQGKGPAAIAREMGCNVGRVTAKLHGLRKSGVLAAPTIAPPRAPSASAPFTEEAEAQKAPEAQAQPAGQPLSSVSAAASPHGAKGPYEAALAKLSEPEPAGINLAKELLDLMDHFELAYSAKPRLLLANPAAGWASCSFDVAGRRYSVSLRERKDKNEAFRA